MKNYFTEHLHVYGVPSGTPSRIGIFSVTVNGYPLGLITERNLWEKPCSFGVFDMEPGYPVTVSIQTEIPFETAALYPLSEGVSLTRSGDTLTYTVDHPINALTLVLNGDYTGETLHIFSNPIDHDAPTESKENLLYVGPGYHNLSAFGGAKPDLPYTSDGTLSLPAGMTLYVAGGAVIDGTIMVNTDDVTIRGSGILMKGEDCAAQTPKSLGICLVTAEAKHIRIENIICHAHRWHNWTVHFWHSEDISVDRIKIFSPVYASTDGIDISNSSHVTVKNSFIRACDDAVAIKGLYGSEYKPQDCLPIRHIHFEHCVLWNDCNNCMGIGAETRASVFEDITFRDIDVIYSYDDRDYHEKLDER
ncbi:MAG: glycosyl hydrolase family 28 protein, partial [Clostridia bacterium]|nr:glycosyl hydrolase family 28 protein [Clostridia bacterium]